jgi:PAS domain S-box-containing protein
VKPLLRLILVTLFLSSALFGAFVFEDKESAYTPEQVMADPSLFKEDDKPAKSFSDSTWWIRVDLRSSEPTPQDLYIRFIQSNLTSVTAYARIDGVLDIQQKGYTVVPELQYVKTEGTVFSYEEVSGTEPLSVYIKVKSDFALNLSYEVEDTMAFLQAYSDIQHNHAYILGAFLLLIVYNLMLFFFSKERFYLYYVLHLIGTFLIALHFYNEWGFVDGLHPYSLHIASFGEALTIIFTVLFLRSLFHATTPVWLHKLVSVIVYVGIARLVLGLFFPAEMLFYGTFSIIPLTLATMLMINYIGYRAGNPIAGYTLLGWSILIAGASVTQGTILGFIQDVSYQPAYVWGGLVEGVILSVALAYRLKIMQDENLRLQELINAELSEEKKHKEQELVNERQKFMSMFYGNKSVMILVRMSDLKILESNASAQAFYGYSEKEFKSLNIYDIDEGNLLPVSDAKQKVDTEKSASFYAVHKLKNKALKSVEVSVSVINDNGEDIAMSIITDVTKRLEDERQLLEQKEQFQNFIEDLGDNFFSYRHDPQGNFTYLSGNVEAILGVKKEDLLGNSFVNALEWTGSSLEKALTEMEVLLKTNKVASRSLEMSFIHPESREEMFINISGHSVLDEHGHVIAIEGIAEDVTQRKEQEHELVRLINKNDALLRTENAAMMHVKDRKIVWVNNKFNALFDYEDGELIGESTRLGFPSDAAYEEFGQKLYSAVSNQVTYDDEIILQTKHGENLNILVSFTAIAPNEVFGVLIDITEKKQQEQALEHLNETLKEKVKEQTGDLRSALEDIEEVQRLTKSGSFVYDVQHDSVKGTDAFFELTGLHPGFRIGEFMAIIHPDDQQMFMHTIEAMMTTQQSRFELNYRLVVDGEIKYVEDHGLYQYDDNGVPLLYKGTIKDITEQVKAERKQKEQEALLLSQQRLVQQGELVQMIAHQWRQPLNEISLGLQMFVKKLKLGKLDEERMDTSSRKILDQVQYLSQTISDFKNFYAPDKAAKYFNLKDEVDAAVHILDHHLKQFQIDVENTIEGSFGITGYQGEVGQVLMVILSNAKDQFEQKESEERRIIIGETHDDAFVTIKICDTAGGIPDDVMPYIWDPYYTTKPDLNGSGVGLYMVKMMVEQSLGGKVTAYNEQKGACFEVTLPMVGVEYDKY